MAQRRLVLHALQGHSKTALQQDKRARGTSPYSVAVATIRRLKNGLNAVLQDAQARHEYAARLRWLMQGSGGLPAWSLEYRAGLRGSFRVDLGRSDGTETFTRSCPDDCQTQAPLAHLYESRFTYHLTDTVANTLTGATLMTSKPHSTFFIRESISWPFESILSHGLDVPRTQDAVAGPEGPTAIFPGTSNYYHWLIEEVPLIIRAQAAEPHIQVIAYAESITARHCTVATTLGFEIHPAPKTVRLAQHVLPGRASDSWFLHPQDAAILFELGQRVTGGPTLSPERIYISRSNASRALSSEAQLEDLLAADGFAIIHPETLSWSEQIFLFQNARVVVGPHGAGLSNLVFSPPGAVLVEITNGHHYNRCYEWLCHVAGHHYVPVSGDDGTFSTPHQLYAAVTAAQ